MPTQDFKGTLNNVINVPKTAFTPILVGASTAGVGTYTGQVGHYARRGNVVFIQGQVAWSAHTGTGQMLVTGLPLTSSASSVGLIKVRTTIPAATDNWLQGIIAAGATQFSVEQIAAVTGAISAVNIIDASHEIRFSGFYFID